MTFLREVVEQDRAWPVLEAALAAKTPQDPKGEARAVAEELYKAVSGRVQLLWLLDRCSNDIPELATIFDDQIRNRYMQDLVDWVMRRRLIATGSRGEAVAAARGAMEVVTWLARNRRGDRTAVTITEDEACDAAVRIFTDAFDYP